MKLTCAKLTMAAAAPSIRQYAIRLVLVNPCAHACPLTTAKLVQSHTEAAAGVPRVRRQGLPPARAPVMQVTLATASRARQSIGAARTAVHKGPRTQLLFC